MGLNSSQHTVAKEITFTGIGLHLGKRVKARILPALPNHGIQFKRIDLNPSVTIPAKLSYVVSTARGTHLGRGKALVYTVEHLLAAFYGMEIDNALVELDGPEIPVGDGSAAGWSRLIKKTGIHDQQTKKRIIRLLRPVQVNLNGSQLLALPSKNLRLSTVIEFKHPFLTRQMTSMELSQRTFIKVLAPARTFCFEEEIKGLLKQGLAKGGSLKNALVIGKRGLLAGKLRFKDEFARHKILDLLGDLALLGYALRAHVIAIRAGHASHLELVKKILAAT